MYLIFPNNLTHSIPDVESYLSLYFSKNKIIKFELDRDFNNLTIGKKLSLLSVELIDKFVHSKELLDSDKTDSMVLTVFNSINIDRITKKLIDDLPTDSVCFDNLDYDQNKNWMLCSIQAFAKLAMPAGKILTPPQFIKSSIYFSEPYGDYFQLVWFAQRVGLKVYES